MDLSVIKTMLDCQDKAYRNSLELFLNQINEKIHSFESTVNDLRRSLEFTQGEVDDLKGEVRSMERERIVDKETIRVMKEDLQVKTHKIQELEDKIIYQEDYNRRKNLQITGLREQQHGETWEQTAVQVSKLFEDKMQLPGMEIERAHRVGQRREEEGRPVIVRFNKFSDREAVLRNCNKLKGTNIYVNEDLSPASQAIKKGKMPLLKQARMDGKIAYFRHTKLIVRDRPGESSRPVVSDQTNRGAGAPPGLASVVAGRTTDAAFGSLPVQGEVGPAAAASAVGNGGVVGAVSAVEGGARKSQQGGQSRDQGVKLRSRK